ncbi:MAG: T9SS type A sorting domain-containing protein [Sphingobacteriales bacterium]|nr:T9SS type A sorting domain-containing protein [Sphingobacteriales bacterium]
MYNNTIGQKVLAKSFTSNTIDLSNLPNGTYYITLSNPQKIVATQMVVKQ